MNFKMKKSSWLLRSVLSFCLSIGFGIYAEARKFNVTMGYFNVSAKTETADGSLNNLGAYNFTFTQTMNDQLEAVLGYTVLMSNVVGGDLSFGLDLGLRYFPLTRLRPQQTEMKTASVFISEIWRPYVGVGFSERRFQSVEANYAGFGITLGTERQLEIENYSLLIELRYTSFSGSSSASADEIILSTGISVPF